MRYRFALMAVPLAGLAACGTPQHSNTLIFGTNTKVAFDVSADAVTQTPGVTLGYTRQEAVWMPLMPNVAHDGKLVPCGADYVSDPGKGITRTTAAAPVNNGQKTACEKFIGTDQEEGQDTYSVLASFGADFSGGGSVNVNTDPDGTERTGDAKVAATAGIAQYFATGLAARKLAEDGARLVSVQPTDQEMYDALMKAQQRRLGISDDELKRYEKEHAQLVAKFMEKCAPGGEINVAACNGLADKAVKSASNPDGVSTQQVQLLKVRIGSKDAGVVQSEVSKWTMVQLYKAL